MHARGIAALIVGAGVIFGSAAAAAQSTDPIPKKKHVAGEQRVATAVRPVARVTVRRRSYLNPGTETKAHGEHYMDYAFPPGDPPGYGGSTSFDNNYNMTFTRSPFPSCFDLQGFCR